VNDPHVKSLTYELETEESVSFDAHPVEHRTDTFSLRLEDGTVHVDLKKHFASVERARNHIEHFLDSWEARDGLEHGRAAFTFSFEGSEVIDRDPPDERGSVSVAGASASIQVTETVEVHVSRPEYPSPPDRFRLSPDAQMLWSRYRGYKEGREHLFSMAYACLTVVEERAGGREQATETYNVEYDVLDNLGRLTAKRGSSEVARKPPYSEGEATSQERQWIEKAISKLILQVGIHDAGHDPSKLTMGDLPEVE
jgi:hypothetical protein